MTGEWIRVDEELPPDGADVLVYVDCCGEGYITAMNYDRGRWYNSVMNCFTCYEITHWMPFPEPPNDAKCERGERA